MMHGHHHRHLHRAEVIAVVRQRLAVRHVKVVIERFRPEMIRARCLWFQVAT